MNLIATNVDVIFFFTQDLQLFKPYTVVFIF